MSKVKAYCDICNIEIEVTMCCNGHQCGCMGLPVEPPICSEKCYDIFMSEKYQKEKKSQQALAAFIKPKTIDMNENLTFGQAIEAAKKGKRVCRAGWNGSGMFAYIVPANTYPAQTEIAKAWFGENGMVSYRAYWALKTAQEDVATWSPSGSDSLAEDWIVLD